MYAIIYQPSKNPMQSGRSKRSLWKLVFKKQTATKVEQLMGWTSENEAYSQIKLEFNSLEQAIAYAEKKEVYYFVKESRSMRRSVKPVYANNFSSTRKENWTH